jgi:polysaccharide biosynthesis transport protein
MNAPLTINRSADHLDREPPEDSIALSELIQQFTGIIRRQFPIFVFVIACVMALGLVYLVTTPARFTSHAILLIDSSKLRVLQSPETPLGDMSIDTSQVETQVEILKSENIALSVIKDLKLTEEPEFVGARGGTTSGLFGLFASSPPESDTTLTRRALGSFLGMRTVTRVGRTYVLDIGFTSLDPTRAAVIANATADAYIVDQLASKYQATKRASVWLQDRIKELRQQASDADRAVLDYKEKNKIISVGGGSPGGGPRLLGEQQLEDLNTQLGSARAAAEETKARLERISDVMNKDVTDATVADSLKNEVITRLRNNYLDLAAKEAIWSARYGPGHLAAVNLRTQMAELRRSIHDELGRIAESYKSDYEISKTRVEGLERELQKLVTRSQITNRDKLGLTDLESTAKVYHSIYDNFLQRYMEAIQQQSFPITEARVISAAAPPSGKSSPKTFLVLAIASSIGLALSFGIALMREAIDRVFRSSRQVETNLRTRCLAVLPMLVPAIQSSAGRSLGDNAGRKAVAMPDLPAAIKSGSAVLTKFSQKGSLDLGRALGTKTDIRDRSVAMSRPFMRQVVEDPLSPFAEGFRAIKVAADISGSRVVGITSTVPGEGKSTVSSNLAELAAHAGKRVILLDADLRNPSLTRAIAAHSKVGLLEVLNGQVGLERALQVDETTGLSVLPIAMSSITPHTNEILSSDAFRALVEDLRNDYEYVIIDLPPIAPIVDVRTTTQVVDTYVYVVEWGRTPINLVQHQLARFPELYDRLLGVVLNKADVRVLERYETYHYGKKYYGGQYYSSKE